MLLEEEYEALGAKLIGEYIRELCYMVEEDEGKWKRFKTIDEELCRKRKEGTCTEIYFSFCVARLEAICEQVREKLWKEKK